MSYLISSQSDKAERLVLPIVIPPIKVMLPWAYTLAITRGHAETREWYLTNFNQLCCYRESFKSEHNFFINFWRGGNNEFIYGNPFLHARVMGYDSFSSIHREESIVDLIIDALRSNFYPTIFVDEAMMSFSPLHGWSHDLTPGGVGPSGVFAHHVLVYGYDTKNRIFNVLGYGRGTGQFRTGKFGEQTVTFDEMVAGVNSIKRAISEGRMHDQLSFFYTPKLGADSFPHRYQFDFDFFKKSLTEYATGTNSLGVHNYNGRELRFGMAVYDELEKYFDRLATNELGKYFDHLADNKSTYKRAETRHIQALWEHKTVLGEKIEFLIEKGLIDNNSQSQKLLSEWKRLTSEIDGLKLLCVMFVIRRQNESFLSVKNSLGRIRQIESALLERLLALLH